MKGVVLPEPSAVDAIRAVIGRDHTLFEIRDGGAGAAWVPATTAAPFDWDRPRPLVSAKPFFFPSRERLLSWTETAIEPAWPDPAPFALIGLHPCDAAAIAYQDRFFMADPWYRRRRERGFIVVVDCPAACEGGFCVDVGSGPIAQRGFDLCWTPLADDRVLVRTATPAADAILAAAGITLALLPPDVVEQWHLVGTRARATFPPRPFVARARERIDARSIPDAEWHALGPACFACTGCTSLCPTCSCFTIVDEARDGGGNRVRTWDSCLLEGFAREASGHHPAAHPGDRVRRFWTHKLEPAFADEAGQLGCVGCGRCDVTCPGQIGAVGVLTRIGAP